MKKNIMMLIMAAGLLSMIPTDNAITVVDGMTVVNTTTIAKDITGYQGATPLKIYIRKNKIVKVEALHNQESPKYFAKVKSGLLDKWNGMSVSKAAKAEVDGVTGATFSSNAVIKNVKRGADYYLKNKK